MNGWFETPRPRPDARLRLYCFPYAGGNSGSIFRHWPAVISPEVDIRFVSLPGRGQRICEPAYQSMETLVSELYRAFLSEPELPFAFLGHSMGALLSFELARMLRRHGQPLPLHLFVSASPAPRRRISRQLSKLTPGDLIAELKRLNGTPQELLANREVMTLLLPTVRADFAVVDSYVCKVEPPLPCPMTAFAGSSDVSVRREDVEAWSQETCSDFRLRMVPGGHFFVNDQRPLMVGEINGSLNNLLGQHLSAVS